MTAALTSTITAAAILAGVALPAPSAASAGGSRTVGSPSPSPTQGSPPLPLSLVTVTSVTATSVSLSWTRPNGSVGGFPPATSYEIHQFQAFTDVPGPVLTVGDVTTATITGLQPTTQYSFTVTGIAANGWRYPPSRSNTTVITPASDTAADTTPPTAPTDLTSTSAGRTLSWSASTDNVGVIGYDVYALERPSGSVLVATVTGTSATVAPRTSPAGASGTYFVRARDAAGNLSIASNEVGYDGRTPPTAPPSTGPPVPTCKVTYRTIAQWNHGFAAHLTIANTAATFANAWTLQYAYGGDQKVVSSWGSGAYVQSGSTVTLKNATWNGTISPGGSITIGVLGTWNTSDAAPTSFTLNGARCAQG